MSCWFCQITMTTISYKQIETQPITIRVVMMVEIRLNFFILPSELIDKVLLSSSRCITMRSDMFTFLEAMLSLRAMLKGLTHFIQMYISIFPLHIKKSRVSGWFSRIDQYNIWKNGIMHCKNTWKQVQTHIFFSSSRTIETPY